MTISSLAGSGALDEIAVSVVAHAVEKAVRPTRIISTPTTQGLTIGLLSCSFVDRYWKNLKIAKPKAIKDVSVRMHAISVREPGVCVPRRVEWM